MRPKLLPLIATFALGSVVLTGCAPGGELVMDGSRPEHGMSAMCSSRAVAEATVFGVGLENTGRTTVTIRGVDPLAVNSVSIDEVSIARSGSGGAGWGIERPTDITSSLLEAWTERVEPGGTVVEPGERVWLLLTMRSTGTELQNTGVRGVRVTYGGETWARSTQNDNVYGFGPQDGECDAGITVDGE